jgi:hypothetical protein
MGKRRPSTCGVFAFMCGKSRKGPVPECELVDAISLTPLWSNRGKIGESRELLAPVYNWFTEGLDTPVLQQAKALLNRLG